MIDLFSSVASSTRITRFKAITIDNIAFRLQYRLTFAIMSACTAFVCYRQYIGEHIQCMVSGGVPVSVVNTYCFITSTYTLPHDAYSTYRGVGPARDDYEQIFHAYYQWVPFILFAQGLMFYATHMLWSWCEGGNLRQLSSGLMRLYLKPDGSEDLETSSNFIPSEATRMAKMRAVLNRLDLITKFQLNRYWALAMIGCELINLINVVAQLMFMDFFLGGQFYSYGMRLFNDESTEFDRVFPKMTKCDFRKYGPSGTIEAYDALCMVALNIVNEKIYAFLWFWFLIYLVPANISALVWRAIQYAFHKNLRFNQWLFEKSGKTADAADMVIVANRTSFSDWLFMNYLSANIDTEIFLQLLRTYATTLTTGICPPSNSPPSNSPPSNSPPSLLPPPQENNDVETEEQDTGTGIDVVDETANNDINENNETENAPEREEIESNSPVTRSTSV